MATFFASVSDCGQDDTAVRAVAELFNQRVSVHDVIKLSGSVPAALAGRTQCLADNDNCIVVNVDCVTCVCSQLPLPWPKFFCFYRRENTVKIAVSVTIIVPDTSVWT